MSIDARNRSANIANEKYRRARDERAARWHSDEKFRALVATIEVEIKTGRFSWEDVYQAVIFLRDKKD